MDTEGVTASDVKAYGEKVEQAITDQAKAGGAAAFNFDPNASPEAKAAQAKKVSSLTC